MAMTLAVFAGYAALAAQVRGAFSRRSGLRRRVEQSMGLLLAGFAARLALIDE